jgi:hypothetical protein
MATVPVRLVQSGANSFSWVKLLVVVMAGTHGDRFGPGVFLRS